MFKKLAYLGLCIGLFATATAVGCGDDSGSGGKPDFSLAGDGGGNNDMNVMKMYMSATPHDIDTNTIGGTFGKGAAVQTTGLIVISPIYGFSANSDKDCKFEVWAQDPMCATPPCGITLVTKAITNPDGVGKFCSFSFASMTALNGVQKGDKIDVKGVVDTFASTAMSPMTGTVVQHEIEIDELTNVAKNQPLPAATAVDDNETTSLFTPYSGTGWAMYEGMLVKVKRAAGGKFTTTLDSFGGWTLAPGGAHFADNFTGLFRPDGAAANMWPPNGSMFTSITGIVSMTFGGGILPSSQSDFEP